jgi:hypothetical protein
MAATKNSQARRNFVQRVTTVGKKGQWSKEKASNDSKKKFSGNNLFWLVFVGTCYDQIQASSLAGTGTRAARNAACKYPNESYVLTIILLQFAFTVFQLRMVLHRTSRPFIAPIAVVGVPANDLP